MASSCTFCEIVAGRLPSRKVHEEDGIVVFHNRLSWFPVQILIVPTEHMTQAETWSSGDLMARMGKLAVKLGSELCPNGYRIVSNFGDDALQTQPHGHIHVVGGAHLGLYASRSKRANLMTQMRAGISRSRSLNTRNVIGTAMAAPAKTSSG